MMKREYRVNGMTCGHCAQSVKSAIENLSTDIVATVDVQSGTVTVENSPPENVVKEAIVDAGYESPGEL